jgi:two-component system, sensor histidine kinase PdtaS
VPTLADRIRAITDLSEHEAQHLRALCSSWQVLADLSFSDLLLYVKRRDEEVFEICAQLRPFTSQTLYPQDMVGTRVTQPEQPIVERAWRERQIWEQDDPVLVNGIPIRLDAIPVHYGHRVIAVLTKEGSPATSRLPGLLEQMYLELAERVSRMILEGTFPWPHTPTGEWPRVGDVLFVLDDSGCVTWASPNAVSHLRRLGIDENVIGRYLDELGLGATPVRLALATQALVDGELSRGDTVVVLRVMPLIDGPHSTGGLALARDVSEIRQKERVISVKDATIREIHHRVKNNLQTIASLLRLQGRRVNSEEARAALRESVLRIGSIALVHETLTEDTSDVVEFGEVARRIGQMVTDGLVLPDRHLAIKVSGRSGRLGADLATPLAVTLTELLQNAIEHAFPDQRSGTVAVEIGREKDQIVMVVRDDGVGIPSGALTGARLGLQIVRSLIDELSGSLEVIGNGGTTVEVRVPTRR